MIQLGFEGCQLPAETPQQLDIKIKKAKLELLEEQLKGDRLLNVHRSLQNEKLRIDIVEMKSRYSSSFGSCDDLDKR